MPLDEERAEYDRQQQRVLGLMRQYGAKEGLKRWQDDRMNIGQRIPLRNANLVGLPLNEAVLDDADLTEATLSCVHAHRTSFVGALLDRADLSGLLGTGAIFTSAEMSGAIFVGAILCAAVLNHVTAWHVKFRGANLSLATADYAKLLFADMRGARCGNAILTNVDCRHAKMVDIDLSGSTVERADLRATSWARTNSSSNARAAIRALLNTSKRMGAKTTLQDVSKHFPEMVWHETAGVIQPRS